MSTGYYYYRCPCPANDCNGAVCRYPEIMPAPTFTAASCGLYTQDRKLIHFSTTAQDASSTHEQSSFLQGPPAESVLRWDAYKNRQERVQPKEIQPKAPARHGQSPQQNCCLRLFALSVDFLFQRFRLLSPATPSSRCSLFPAGSSVFFVLAMSCHSSHQESVCALLVCTCLIPPFLSA